MMRSLQRLVFNSGLLISLMLSGIMSFSQGLSSKVTYEARDSIVANLPDQIVRLYGAALVQFEDIELRADFIEVDMKKGEVLATYTLDSAGVPVGKPVFTSGGEESHCDYIRYNFNTKKGYVKEVRAQQGEGYIHMAESKIHPNEQVHLHDGKFTTCDADTPHYHFKLTRAIIVPDERIVTGPVYMKLFKIPLPLAAPFGFFPNSDSKKHGIIIPRLANTDQYGFGLQDFGYYIPLGDYWETYFYGTVFTTGRFGVQNISNYLRKYKYEGTVGLKFEQFRGKFYDSLVTNKWTFTWQHNQDAKAHPSIKFSSNINFVSDNNAKTTLDAINPDFYNNQFNSAINTSKIWRTENLNGTMGLKLGLQQNSQSGNYTVDIPSFNLSVNRFDLGVLRTEKIGRKWYENINVQYAMNARNYIAAPDSVFDPTNLYLLNDYVLNGIEHRASMVSNLRLFGGRIMASPQVSYTEIWNFQYEKNTWNPGSEKIDTTEINEFKAARSMSFSTSLNSNFFGYYKMLGKRQAKFRHVASPVLSFSYRPDMGLYEQIQIDTNNNTSYYSPFQSSLYREPGFGESGEISFSLGNTLEMKMLDKRDTINETFKNYKLVDAFSVSGRYDIFKDSLNLSYFNFAFRTARFLNTFSFQSAAVLSPYGFDTNTGLEGSEYAWNTSQGVGRITTGTLAGVASFSNTSLKKKESAASTPEANSSGNNASSSSTNFPWRLNLSYNLNYTRGALKNASLVYIDSIRIIQTLRADGDFSLTEKWNFTYGIAFDFQAEELNEIIPTYNFSIRRDLHCWEAYLSWVQYGPMKKNAPTFLFRVNIKASMFQDIKVELTRPPFFF